MSFAWLPFVQRYGIQFIERGPNVGRNRINVACPLCGNDPSHHLGLEIDGPRWACWRDAGHRSAKPQRLIRAFLRCTIEEADAIAQEGAGRSVGLGELQDKLKSLGTPEKKKKMTKVEFPPEVHRITTSGSSVRFLRYLNGRGFPKEDCVPVVEQYRLRYAMAGPHELRLIFPVRNAGGLVGWTGRTIANDPARYKAFPTGDAVKHGVVNYTGARDARVLVVCEGALDAIKLDFYGQKYGVRAVALMGISASPQQIALLLDMLTSCEHGVVVLDPGYRRAAERIAGQLAVSQRVLAHDISEDEDGAEDLGAMTPQGARRFAKELLRRCGL